MKRIFVPVAVMAVLCSLAISVAPALGHEFYGDLTSPTEATTTAPVFQVGSSGAVECSKIKMEVFPQIGPEQKLKLKMEEFTGCFYNHNLKDETMTVSPKCPIVLKSTALAEEFTNEFSEGRAKLECNLHFKGKGVCEIILKEPATVLPEFAWRNTDTMSGHYESLLILRLEQLGYTITGSGCGSNGTNGEIDASVPVVGVIVK
jgi:hypothetical protein